MKMSFRVMPLVPVVCWTMLIFGVVAQDAHEPKPPVKIIFDTDMDSDCDDVGALAMLHVMTDQGESENLATMVSSSFTRTILSNGATTRTNATVIC